MQKILIHPGLDTSTHFVSTAILPKIADVQVVTGSDSLRDSYLHPTDESKRQFLTSIDSSKPLLIVDGAITAHDPLIGILNCADVFPDASVMLTMSNQWDTLISNYLQQVGNGLYFFPFKTFLMAERTGLVLKTTAAKNIIAMLMEKFDGRVKVFFHEEYRHSIEPVVQHILQTLDISQNFSGINFDEKIDFHNQNILGLSKIMRIYNLAYFAFNCRLLPPKVRGFVESRKSWIGRLIKDSRYLAEQKKIKLPEYKKLITSFYGEAFEQSNYDLEKILDRNLPPEYFPSRFG